MNPKSNKPVSNELDRLRNENAALREENSTLMERISFLEEHPSLVEGLRGEQLIHRITGGMLTSRTDSHDLKADTGDIIEIKMARLNRAAKGEKTKRWAWAGVFGETGSKEYDFLILVGHVDERFQQKYKDPSSPYILFLVPYDEVRPLTAKSGEREYIFLTTNPDKVHSRAKKLFIDYQVSIDELHKKFSGFS